MNLFNLIYIQIFVLLLSGKVIGQQNSSPSLVYQTKSHFKTNQPVENPFLEIRKELVNKKGDQKGAEKIIIYDLKKNSKLKKTFAVEINGQTYFQTSEIFRNLNKKDKVQTAYNPHSYIKVISTSDDYIYTEMVSANSWGQGFGAGVGGVLGAGLMMSANNLTGVIFDKRNDEFNILRNCKDTQKFISEHLPEYGLSCDQKRVPITDIREIVTKLLGKELEGLDIEAIKNQNLSKRLVIFPHKSAWELSTNLSFDGENYSYNALEIIELDLGEDVNRNLCIEQSKSCIDLQSRDEVVYAMIKIDKKSKEIQLIESDDSQFKYYNALLTRRLKKN